MRVVGLDIHRVFAEAVMLDEGKLVRLGRIGMTRDHLGAFARTLTHDDHVVVEATGNASAVAEVIAPHVGNRCERLTWRRGLTMLQYAGSGSSLRVTGWIMPMIVPCISTGTMVMGIVGSS